MQQAGDPSALSKREEQYKLLKTKQGNEKSQPTSPKTGTAIELVISGSKLLPQLWETQRFSKAVLLLGRFFFFNSPSEAVVCCNEALPNKGLSGKEDDASIYPLKEDRLLLLSSKKGF